MSAIALHINLMASAETTPIQDRRVFTQSEKRGGVSAD